MISGRSRVPGGARWACLPGNLPPPQPPGAVRIYQWDFTHSQANVSTCSFFVGI